MKLIEPLGLLFGPAAEDAVAAGLACLLAGGPAAFVLAGLIDTEAGNVRRIVPVADVPDSFRPALATLAAATPGWADLPGPKPWIMGVLNITPDSFSDGGRHGGPAQAVAAGLAMFQAGADIVDVGGESTRPKSRPVSPSEEQDRILPVIAALAEAGHAVSVDTRNAGTMRAALAAGARVVNDVSGLRHDAAAAGVAAGADCPVILMHMRGDPADMHEHATYGDVAIDVTCELAAGIALATAAGVSRTRIAIDPGIGFAKRGEHNLALLPRLAVLRNLRCPIVLGASRKQFIGTLANEPVARNRTPGSLAAALSTLPHADLLRVHDVAETVQAVRVWRGVTGMG